MIAPSQEGIILYLIWGLFVCFIICVTYQYYIKAIKPRLIYAGCSNVRSKQILLKKLRDNLIRKRVYNIKTESYWIPLDDIYKEFEIELETPIRGKI